MDEVSNVPSGIFRKALEALVQVMLQSILHNTMNLVDAAMKK